MDRVIVWIANATHHLKFVCCKARCPGSTTADTAAQRSRNATDEIHLYNLQGAAFERGGRFEAPETDLAPTAAPELLKRLVGMLPKAERLPYEWPGCDLSGWVD